MITIGIVGMAVDQHSVADSGIAIADPSQTTQHESGLHDVFQEYEKQDVSVDCDFAGCEHDPAGKERDSSGCVAQQGKRVDDQLRNAETAEHDNESEKRCPHDRLFDSFGDFASENRGVRSGGRCRMLLFLRFRRLFL